MREIVFATNNKHKLEEIREIIGSKFKILSLEDIGCFDDIPETANTLSGNAFIKANWVKEKYGFDCFADDSGLEVEALNNEPGVYSARYAGENVTYQDNNSLLLKNLQGIENRNAQFKTVICLILNSQINYFEGTVKGKITTKNIGEFGFGYDPLFIPDGYKQTFAELGSDIKNTISHRYFATKKLYEFLEKL